MSLFAFVSVVLCLFAGAVMAIPVSDYLWRLESAVSLLTTAAEVRDAARQQKALQQTRDLLRGIESVELATGESIRVDFSWLDRVALEPTRDRKETLSETTQTLTLYRDELRQLLSGSFHSELRAGRWAKEIVSRREFHLQIPWIQIFMARILGAVIEFLSEHASSRGLKTLYWFLVGIGIATVLGIFVYLARSIRRSVLREAQQGEAAEAEQSERFRTFGEWQAAAREQASRGEYRQAVRGLYHSLLIFLDEKGLLHYDRNWTNWEHVRAVQKALGAASGADLREHLVETTRFFERKWYGLEPCAEQEYSAFHANLARLVERVTTRQPALAGGTAP